MSFQQTASISPGNSGGPLFVKGTNKARRLPERENRANLSMAGTSLNSVPPNVNECDNICSLVSLFRASAKGNPSEKTEVACLQKFLF